VRWVRSMAALLGCCLLLSGASSAPEPSKAARLAVLAVGHCDAPSTAISTRSFRALLQPKLGAVLQSEADTARALGGLSERTLEEVERAVSTARKDFYAHQVEAAVAHLKELAVDVTRVAPSTERWKVERDVLTLLAQAQVPADASGAEATLSFILRVEPDYQPDTGLYPPSFRKFADGVRAKQAELPTNRLDVAVSPSGRPVYIGGFPMGTAPLSHHLPAGEYRVEADFGHRALVRTVHVPPPPAVVAPVELAGTVEGALFADGGPCVEPGLDRSASLARVMALVGANRLFAIHDETAAGRHWVSVDEVDVAGGVLREARSQLQQGAPETDALAALADWAATGHAATSVEILKRAGAVGAAVASQTSTRGQLSGSVLGQPRPSGFMLESFPVNGQIPPGPGVHFSGTQFKSVDQPAGKASLRVVTDDGRVGTTTVDVPAGGSAEVTVQVDVACTAGGRVVNAKGQPAPRAHLVAQQLGSRISESVETGSKGRFVFRELTKGDYLLSVAVGAAHAVRRFSVDSSCAADLGTVMMPETTASEKTPR
jgi:Carboxypeptidase regulatory-like domain/PEGA domain